MSQSKSGFLNGFLERIGLTKKQGLIRAIGLGVFLILMAVLFIMANATLDYLLPPTTGIDYTRFTYIVQSDGWILVKQLYLSNVCVVPLGIVANLILAAILVLVLLVVSLKYLFRALVISGKMSQKALNISTTVCFALSAVLFLTLLIIGCMVATGNFPSPIVDSATGNPIDTKAGLDETFDPKLMDLSNNVTPIPFPSTGWGQWYYWIYWTLSPLVLVLFAGAVFSGISFFKGVGIPWFKRISGKKAEK